MKGQPLVEILIPGPAVQLDRLARQLLVERGARSNVYVGRHFGCPHPQQWALYTSGQHSPKASTVMGWLEAWAERAAADDLPALELVWTHSGCSARVAAL